MSIYFLEKFGLSHAIAHKLSTAGFTLLDFFILNNEKIYSKAVSNSNRKKIFSAIENSLMSPKFKDGIYDDIVMLTSVGASLNSRIYHFTNSISELSALLKTNDWVKEGLSVASKKASKYIKEYELSVASSREKELWEAFIIFLKNPKIDSNSISDYHLNRQVVEELKNLEVISCDKGILYLNLYNIKYYPELIKIFNIDTKLIPKINKSEPVTASQILSLDELLQIDFKDKDLFIQRIEGKTLQEIGDRTGITRERTRQRIARVLKNLPQIKEVQTYKAYFTKYDIGKDIFMYVYNSDGRIYELLNLLFKKGKKDVTNEIINGNYSQKAKDYFLNTHRKVKFADTIKEMTKENALVEIMKANQSLQTYLSPEEMLYLYNEYVQKYPKLSVKYPRSLYRIADDSQNIIKSQGRGYRYFTINLSDKLMRRLTNIINVLPPGAYHMDYVYNNNLEFMRSIGILNGSELHNLYLIYNIPVTEMHLGRNPEFIVKINSKRDFIFRKMLNFHGKPVEEFVNLLNSNYGLRKKSLFSYLSMELGEYIQKGIIVIDSSDYSNLKGCLSPILTKDIYTAKDFSKIIKKYSSLDNITPLLIHELGYLDRGNLVISNKFKSSKEALTATILANEVFTITSDDVFKTGDFYSTFYSLEKNFKILKIAENTYLNTEKLLKYGFDFKKFKRFIEKVENEVEDNSYFTIQSLINNGFTTDLINEGFEKITLDRLIGISRKLKPVNSSFPTLYYKGDKKKNVDDFLLDLLLDEGEVKLDDFINSINEFYGLSLERHDIRYRLRRQGVFYSKKLDKAYIYEENNLAEIDKGGDTLG
ncbi:sigma factor-like helix-turn-helix DNA-binding protein [Streptococcus sp. H31]|uniref:sigma factor-like helix-turn-helix DNA-binding protein n=1 Tax=Streptococcus huangxiaojuni TaxID=3237239 RepID=UPI0034A3F2C5